MGFYNEKFSILTDSLGNIYNLEWRDGLLLGFVLTVLMEKWRKTKL